MTVSIKSVFNRRMSASRCLAGVLAAAGWIFLPASTALGQWTLGAPVMPNITTQTQATGISSSFGETQSSNFQLSGPGWTVSNNLNVSTGIGTPLVNQGLSTGAAFGGNGINGRIGLNWAQGSSSFAGGTTQSLTTTDGVPGFIQTGQYVPFVTGVTPIVGSGGVGYGPVVVMPAYPNPYGTSAAMMNQSNAVVMNQVANNQAQWNQSRLELYLRRTEMAMKDQDIKRARANLAMAIGYAPQPLKAQLQNQLKQLKKQK